ncbi:MAG: protein kinase [Acidobacteriia bacterium]|nr:protein kinase [Terriglobia bacterium]
MFNGATFGAFELDIRKRELRKHGIRLRLPDQSFEILTMLAERPGEVITREEIRERLWPNGTIVEFEHSMNSALKRLRDALGDSATMPRFIETVPRRGYTFVASVEWLGPDASSARFRLLEEVGRGAMGIVYRAEDLRLGRPVALKFLPEELASHPPALRQLRREARTAAARNHPNICTLHGIEEHEGRLCLVMEYLEGRPLSRLIEATPLPSRQAIDFAIQACNALETAHARSIIHRDLKPANLFVTGSGQVKLTDFGIAVWAGETGAAQAGTPSYMSPEPTSTNSPWKASNRVWPTCSRLSTKIPRIRSPMQAWRWATASWVTNGFRTLSSGPRRRLSSLWTWADRWPRPTRR